MDMRVWLGVGCEFLEVLVMLMRAVRFGSDALYEVYEYRTTTATQSWRFVIWTRFGVRVGE